MTIDFHPDTIPTDDLHATQYYSTAVTTCADKYLIVCYIWIFKPDQRSNYPVIYKS